MKVIVLPKSWVELGVGFGFGAFNAAGALTLIYAAPLLQEVLEPFDPTYHFSASIWFAIVTIYCTFGAWVMAGRPVQALPSHGRLLECSVFWGAGAGVVFALAWLAFAVFTGIIMGIAESDSQRLIGSILGGIFFAVGGAMFGGLIGGICGIVAGAIDVAILLILRQLPGFPRASRGNEGAT